MFFPRRNREAAPVMPETNEENKIETEFDEAKTRFSPLIELVNQRYEAKDSTIANKPEQLETFKAHNNDILKMCVELGLKKDFTDKELQTLEVSAILHDGTKADLPEEGAQNIPNYALAVHGEKMAGEVDDILNENPNILKEILGENYDPKEGEATAENIKTAIRCHMGPHPGFMTGILSGVNAKIKESNSGLQEIEHPYPPEGDKIAETLLAADMASLADSGGRKKIMAIRADVPFFTDQDQKLVNSYKNKGIDLLMGEAALLSGFDSAEQARDMIKNEEDKEWINQKIEESKKQSYAYKNKGLKIDQLVNYSSAQGKREKFLKAQQEIAEK